MTGNLHPRMTKAKKQIVPDVQRAARFDRCTPTGEKRGRLHSLPKFTRSRGCIFIEATKYDDLQEPDRFTGLSMLNP